MMEHGQLHNLAVCEKLLQIKDESQSIGAFLDWLTTERKLTLCEPYGETDYLPVYLNIEKLLAEYYNIDLDKLEQEKQAILKKLRERS